MGDSNLAVRFPRAFLTAFLVDLLRPDAQIIWRWGDESNTRTGKL